MDDDGVPDLALGRFPLRNSADLRQSLLDKGLLPDTEVELLRSGVVLVVKLQGFELELNAAEGQAVLVEPR